jgi:hypothetical protein
MVIDVHKDVVQAISYGLSLQQSAIQSQFLLFSHFAYAAILRSWIASLQSPITFMTFPAPTSYLKYHLI